MNYNQITSSQSPSNLPEQKLSQPVNEFDYEKLNADIRTVVQQSTREIKNLMRRTTEDVISIGQKLFNVKAQLGHGNFRKWLKSEFNWSVKTANRFMHVAENFKCVTLTHLDITDSALYFLASPSTPQEARIKALQRATNGEKINYTLARAIVFEHKKTTQPKSTKSVSCDVDTQTLPNQTNGVQDILPDMIEQELETELHLLSTEDSVSYSGSKDQLILATSKRNQEQLEDMEPTYSIENQNVLPENTPETIVTEIESKIKQLPSEKLSDVALTVINYFKDRLSKSQFTTIINDVLNH